MSRPQGIFPCGLYEDPTNGLPSSFALDTTPEIANYPDGMTRSSPKALDFNPDKMLGCVSGELGLRKFLGEAGHTLVVTSSKDGGSSEADSEFTDTDIVISQPFWPYYLTR